MFSFPYHSVIGDSPPLPWERTHTRYVWDGRSDSDSSGGNNIDNNNNISNTNNGNADNNNGQNDNDENMNIDYEGDGKDDSAVEQLFNNNNDINVCF